MDLNVMRGPLFFPFFKILYSFQLSCSDSLLLIQEDVAQYAKSWAKDMLVSSEEFCKICKGEEKPGLENVRTL